MNATTRRLTAKQLAKALAEIDANLNAIDQALAEFEAVWAGGTVPDAVCDAWNHLHDAHAALTAHRAQVEMNPRPIPAAEMGTWELVQQNID